MAKIAVIVRSDRGDLGIHLKFGALVPGAEMTIEEEDFGDELFERPHADFLSPHEQTDLARAGELKQRVGKQEPPEESDQGKPQGDLGEESKPAVPKETNNNKEVKADA